MALDFGSVFRRNTGDLDRFKGTEPRGSGSAPLMQNTQFTKNKPGLDFGSLSSFGNMFSNMFGGGNQMRPSLSRPTIPSMNTGLGSGRTGGVGRMSYAPPMQAPAPQMPSLDVGPSTPPTLPDASFGASLISQSGNQPMQPDMSRLHWGNFNPARQGSRPGMGMWNTYNAL